ncbi:HPr kinase/phosphorylase [Phenylobacterium sp. J426]|uniref:HPr kinase/phosphorylase n=1 Tax=Phenylobacterium sp. J426 TaxID=2898439 RepID=UPI002150DE46|nr:HPr kinase/phosphorylase [Phenylobacterium sp. J426]MCR5873830.1 HPr kinase/phosphorylase [Phenylobacterium sp. J426]
MIRHAGLIAQRVGGRWIGVLIEGPSGAGKSDLALRAIGQGFRLVADDRVVLWTSGGRLYGRAPEALHGLIEVRGLDVIRADALSLAEVGLVARLGEPDRIPDPEFHDILGVSIPAMTTSAFEESAPAKLSRALSSFDAAHNRRI